MNRYEKYFPYKNILEDLFGSDAWYQLKESNYLPTWKKYSANALKAIRISITDTVKIYDEDWLIQINSIIDRGISQIKSCDAIDEVIAVVAATMIRVSFAQVGLMPSRTGDDRKVQLRAGSWNLNMYRSVQYVQSNEQKENLFWAKQQKQLGVSQQMDLWRQYRKSKAKEPYSIWCDAINFKDK